MTQSVRIAALGQVPAGTCASVEIEGYRFAVVNLDGEYYVIDDTCPHEGASLSGGDLDGQVLRCPWHGTEFDVKTGESLGPPATSDVACYKVRVEGDEIQIELE